jgi:hypothetical protein
MAIPLYDIPPDGALSEEEIQVVLSAETERLTEDLEHLEKLRDYYGGAQTLNFATDDFLKAFGDQFATFRDNWCEVVVDAVQDRLDLQNMLLYPEGSQTPDQTISQRVWDELEKNEFELVQDDLYNGSLVEGTAFVIVWPEEDKVQIDPNYAQNVRVTYQSKDWRKAKHAIKRWVTETGAVYLTLYTSDWVYKFELPPEERLRLLDPKDHVPTETSGWKQRVVPNEEWPLRNPFGIVPVVEFPNRRDESEIEQVIPIQDMLNKTMVDMAVSAEYGAFRQRFIVSSNREPSGGWKASPGYVWHLTPVVDVEGRPLPTQIGTLEESDPIAYIRIIEMLLQHLSAITRTPQHMVLQTSKSGGRGDAPSGESLRVAETGLIKKVTKLQRLWGPRWLRVGHLVAMALNGFPEEFTLDGAAMAGETSWAHPMSHHQTVLLEEGRRMIDDLGLPPEFAWRHLGLSETQIDMAKQFKEEQERKRQEQFEQQQAAQQAARQAPTPGAEPPQPPPD